jgi:exosortase
VAMIAAYLPVLKNLIIVWANSDEYSHGFFIIPLAVYMIWRKRNLIQAIKPIPSWNGLIALTAVLIVYVLSSIMRISTVSSFTFLLCIAAIVLFLYGFEMLRIVSFPIFFLLLMIPVPEQVYSSVTLQLQLLVSKFSYAIASIAGIPIFREGNIIHLPNRTLQVVEACSGIRSLISLLTLCLVIGYFGLQSNALRALLAISSIPIAVAVNVIRVLLLITAFYFFQIDLTEDPLHTYLGVAIFIIALGVALCCLKGLSMWEN